MSRLQWQCRRGMLELDLYLTKFLEKKYQYLSDEQKMLFESLLSEPDPVLLAWFTGQLTPKDAGMMALVAEIRLV